MNIDFEWGKRLGWDGPYWFSLGGPVLHVGKSRTRLCPWNLFSRFMEGGDVSYGASLLQVNGRHLLGAFHDKRDDRRETRVWLCFMQVKP
jgi:hypothetical protein